MSFGEALDKTLKLRGYKRTEFAKEVGVAYKTVWAWINGKHNPAVYYLKKIAEVLNCDLDNLLEYF